MIPRLGFTRELLSDELVCIIYSVGSSEYNTGLKYKCADDNVMNGREGSRANISKQKFT